MSEPFFQPDNKALITLFRNLGPGVLRLGGISADSTYWDASGTGLTTKKVSPPDIRRLAEFLKATGWKVIYGINLRTNTPETAASEALSAFSLCRDSLGWFEIGNEPENYVSTGNRPHSYSYAGFVEEWDSYAAAIREKVPSVPLVGPDVGTRYQGWTLPFSLDRGNSIDLLTQHYYRADGRQASSTMDLLLSPDPKLVPWLESLTAAAKSNGSKGGFRMTECNSFTNGGSLGISNSFGTALWAIDFMFANAAAGSTGVNFHGGGNDPGYTPIADDLQGNIVGIRPVYYALFLFSKVLPGRLLDCSLEPARPGASSYALQAQDGSRWVILVLKTQTEVKIPLGGSWATTWVLTSPSLTSTTGHTFGAAEIKPDGTWSPQPTILSPEKDNTITVKVDGGSAVLIHLMK